MTASRPLPAVPSLDAWRSSGSSPTPDAPLSLHLLGPGKVGRALLRLLASPSSPPCRLVSATDSTATLYAASGLDPLALRAWKEAGRPLAELPGSQRVSTALALSLVRADWVADCTDTHLPEAEAALARSLSILQSGSGLLLGAKAALLAGATRLLEGPWRDRLGCNAALGGTGLALRRELSGLREACTAVACVPNATTTLLVTVLEEGGSLEDGLARARGLGLLEADPSQDLDGTDAALKLLIVAEAVLGLRARLGDVERPDARALDPGLLRRRRARGATTRLVGRACPGRGPRLAFEEVPAGSTLAVPAQRVLYAYDLEGPRRRIHLGAGVGPQGTAAALLADLAALAAGRRAP